MGGLGCYVLCWDRAMMASSMLARAESRWSWASLPGGVSRYSWMRPSAASMSLRAVRMAGEWGVERIGI